MLAPYSTPHAPFTQVRSHAGIRHAPCGLQPDRSVQRSDGYAISRDPRRSARSRFMLGHVYAGYCLPALAPTRLVRCGTPRFQVKASSSGSGTRTRARPRRAVRIAVRARQKATRTRAV